MHVNTITEKVFLFLLVGTLGICACRGTGEKGKAGNELSKSWGCDCALTEDQMQKECPVLALGDSVVICKTGTISVPGSDLGTMTWQEYIASKYFGGEGPVVDCKTGKRLFAEEGSPVLSYKDKRLLVDQRITISVYDTVNKEWVDGLELPAWRNTVYAQAGKLQVSADSMIYKPPYESRQAFAVADKEYLEEQQRTDHYLLSQLVLRLFACAMNGDTLSETRLLHIEDEYQLYLASQPEAKTFTARYVRLYKAYQSYLIAGGKREYFDLTVFPYFQNIKKRNRS